VAGSHEETSAAKVPAVAKPADVSEDEHAARRSRSVGGRTMPMTGEQVFGASYNFTAVADGACRETR